MNILFTYAKNTLKGGLLYNRPTVEDVRELAPVGYRIATVTDMLDLITFYGTSAVAGGDLKALESWKDPNTGAANTDGFTALPAGQRNGIGAFSGILEKTIFWIK